MSNEIELQNSESAEDQTSQTNDEGQDTQHDSLETLKAQKNHWRDNAIDPETGKKYKDLYQEALKGSGTKKEDKKSSSKSGNDNLLEKTFLRAANIADPEEIDMALETASKWGVSIDQLVDDADFKMKLQKFRDERANERATTEVKGNRGSGSTGAKNTAEFYISRGTPPTPQEVPDRKIRASIIRGFLSSQKSSKTFYSD